jgi:hypothetical protein
VPRRETVRDKLARKLEEHADEVVAAYLKGVRSADVRQAYKAAEAWLSRLHGRPTQVVEETKHDDDGYELERSQPAGAELARGSLVSRLRGGAYPLILHANPGPSSVPGAS